MVRNPFFISHVVFWWCISLGYGNILTVRCHGHRPFWRCGAMGIDHFDIAVQWALTILTLRCPRALAILTLWCHVHWPFWHCGAMGNHSSATYSKTSLQRSQKQDALVLVETIDCFMQHRSYAENSLGSFLHNFCTARSCHLSLELTMTLFAGGCCRQVIL